MEADEDGSEALDASGYDDGDSDGSSSDHNHDQSNEPPSGQRQKILRDRPEADMRRQQGLPSSDMCKGVLRYASYFYGGRIRRGEEIVRERGPYPWQEERARSRKRNRESRSRSRGGKDEQGISGVESATDGERIEDTRPSRKRKKESQSRSRSELDDGGTSGVEMTTEGERSEGTRPARKRKADGKTMAHASLHSLDETALLAMSILLEESARAVVAPQASGAEGWRALVRGLKSADSLEVVERDGPIIQREGRRRSSASGRDEMRMSSRSRTGSGSGSNGRTKTGDVDDLEDSSARKMGDTNDLVGSSDRDMADDKDDTAAAEGESEDESERSDASSMSVTPVLSAETIDSDSDGSNDSVH